MCGLAARTGCRSVRAFGAPVRFAQDRSVPGQSCFVVIRGFEDLLELVQVLLHAVFQQLGCESYLEPAPVGFAVVLVTCWTASYHRGMFCGWAMKAKTSAGGRRMSMASWKAPMFDPSGGIGVVGLMSRVQTCGPSATRDCASPRSSRR